MSQAHGDSAPLRISPKMIGCRLYNDGQVGDWDLKEGSQFTSMLNTWCGLRWNSPEGSFCLLMPQASVPKAHGAESATFWLSFYICNLSYSFIPPFHIFNFFLVTCFWSWRSFSARYEHLESTGVSMLSRAWRKCIHLKAPMQKTVSSLDQISPNPDCRQRCAAFEMTFTWLADDIILLIRAESQFPECSCQSDGCKYAHDAFFNNRFVKQTWEHHRVYREFTQTHFLFYRPFF